MLVEDFIFFREIVREELLSRFSPIKIIEASNGEAALRGLASYPIDLIFMDITLPGENGILLTKKIKASNKTVAVVMLSAFDLDHYRRAALESGANGFIAKASLDLFRQILTVVGCFREAKEAGRLKPYCLLIGSKEY
jgi:two-component system OmpR family response regulator